MAPTAATKTATRTEYYARDASNHDRVAVVVGIFQTAVRYTFLISFTPAEKNDRDALRSVTAASPKPPLPIGIICARRCVQCVHACVRKHLLWCDADHIPRALSELRLLLGAR
jgi:hypothetical protein